MVICGLHVAKSVKLFGMREKAIHYVIPYAVTAIIDHQNVALNYRISFCINFF